MCGLNLLDENVKYHTAFGDMTALELLKTKQYQILDDLIEDNRWTIELYHCGENYKIGAILNDDGEPVYAVYRGAPTAPYTYTCQNHNCRKEFELGESGDTEYCSSCKNDC